MAQNKIVSFIFNASYKQDYINSIMLQIMYYYSPMDLKIALFTTEENSNKWDYIKYLPHVWSAKRDKRLYAENDNESLLLSSYLDQIFDKRVKITEENQEKEKVVTAEKKDLYKNYTEYYLIITDNFKEVKNVPIVDRLLNSNVNVGFSLVVFGDDIKTLPSKLDKFVDVQTNISGVYSKDLKNNDKCQFKSEYVPNIRLEKFAKCIANIPIDNKVAGYNLPTSLNFMELYHAGKISHLNITKKWVENDPTVSLFAPIGVKDNGKVIGLDLHEKVHGPHGLIAGSTGSGKSEFIITFILSMAINYHPNEVQFILIDYKGGGLAGSFFNKETGVKLPHLVGIITNLDSSTMNRSLMSIESEVKRRQVIFNEVRESLGEGTIDIYKYQKLYREGIAKKPMAHLFIICDEFAELKQQQPDFMTQLISISRIGRSLGIHLILSTQKPSGIVNDQIWANSRFKVCLKVQDKNDSMEVLKKPDAASIKEIGRFYLQVGYDELFEIGQSGWSGAKYTPSDKIIIKKDESINYINSVGYSLKTIKEENDNNVVVDYGDELTNIVKYLSDIGIKENIQTKRLWLDPLPSIINITELKNKYSYNPTKNKITPVIGEYDDPVNQVQNILTLDLSDNGNTIIYGSPGSGKDILLTNVIRSCIVEHSPEEVSIYGIDCGSQTLGIFNIFPHVGDIVTIDDEEQIKDLIRMLEKEIDVRKDLFQNYGGNYSDYIANSSKSLPMMVVCINNFDAFEETYEDLIDNLQTVIRDGSKYGIVFVLTAVNTNALKQRMASYFKNIICLHLNDKDDYRIVLNTPRELVPADNYGRGLIAIDESIYEFQTGVFADKKDQVTSLKTLAEEINSKYTNKANRIPTIPKRVLVDALLKEDYTRDNIPLGYNYENKGLSYFDFRKNRISSIVYANNNSDNMMFITSLVQLIEKNNEVIVLDINKVLDDYLAINHIINNDYDELFSILDDNVKNTKNTKKDIYLIVVGVGNISNVLSDYGMTTFESIVENTNNTSYLHIVLFDQINGYKNIKPSSIGKYIDTNNYIFLGDGIATQSVFSSPNIGFSYKKIDFPCMAYVVKNGKYELIKHVVDGEAIDE
jgi:S-DNA-T family DNA segregation ATPase FtsK/SpoIIIE